MIQNYLQKRFNNIIKLVKASADATNPSCSVRLEIEANQEGSFETVLRVVEVGNTLFTYASNIARCVSGLFKIKKHIQGERPKIQKKKDNKTAITNQENKEICVDSSTCDAFFKNSEIENTCITMIKDLKKKWKKEFHSKV